MPSLQERLSLFRQNIVGKMISPKQITQNNISTNNLPNNVVPPVINVDPQPNNVVPQVNILPQPINVVPQPNIVAPQPINVVPQPNNVVPQVNILPQPNNVVPQQNIDNEDIITLGTEIFSALIVEDKVDLALYSTIDNLNERDLNMIIPNLSRSLSYAKTILDGKKNKKNTNHKTKVFNKRKADVDSVMVDTINLNIGRDNLIRSFTDLALSAKTCCYIHNNNDALCKAKAKVGDVYCSKHDLKDRNNEYAEQKYLDTNQRLPKRQKIDDDEDFVDV